MSRTRKFFIGLAKTIAWIFAAILVFVLIIVGLRLYHGNLYPITANMAESGSIEKSQYEQWGQTLEGITVTAIEGDYLNGFHFSPEHRNYPGTLVVHGGSEGSPAFDQAIMLSEQGYEVLALYFWGQTNQAPTLANVPLDQFDEVYEYIQAEVPNPSPITVIGSSKGAEYVELLAAYDYPVDNVVAFTPADHSYSGLDFSSSEEFPSFTHRGEAVPFASFRAVSFPTMAKMMWDLLVALPPSYRQSYVEAAEHDGADAQIDMRNFEGNALFFGGELDAMWQGDKAASNMAEQSPRFEAVIYPDAGHHFMEYIESLGNGWQLMLGGTAEGNAKAYAESTELLLERLAEWHGAT